MQPSEHATQQRIEQRRAVQRGSLSLFTGFLVVFLLALGFVKLTREVVENETLGAGRIHRTRCPFARHSDADNIDGDHH